MPLLSAGVRVVHDGSIPFRSGGTGSAPAGAAVAGTGSGRSGQVERPGGDAPPPPRLSAAVFSLAAGWPWVPRGLRDPPGALQPWRDGAGFGDEHVDDGSQAAAAASGALPCR